MPPVTKQEAEQPDDASRLLNALTVQRSQLLEAASHHLLLGDNGDTPPRASLGGLLEPAAHAQALAHDIAHLTADFAESSRSTSRSGRIVLTRLATATTMSFQAAAHFAESAEGSLSLSRSSSPAVRRYAEDRLLVDHSSARAFLRRAAETCSEAAEELNGRLGAHEN